MFVFVLCIDYVFILWDDGWQVMVVQWLDINVLWELVGWLWLWVVVIVLDVSVFGVFFFWMIVVDQGLVWWDEKYWLWVICEVWGSDVCVDVGFLSQLVGQFQVLLCLCIDVGDEVSCFDVW